MRDPIEVERKNIILTAKVILNCQTLMTMRIGLHFDREEFYK